MNTTARGQPQKCPEAWKRNKLLWYSPLSKFSRNTVENIALKYSFFPLDQCQFGNIAVLRAFAFNAAVE